MANLYTLEDPNTLAIGSNVTPLAVAVSTEAAASVKVTIQTPSAGAGVILNIYQSGLFWMQLDIPAGSFSVSATSAQIAAAGDIQAGDIFRVDLIQVGTTTPGAVLLVSIVGSGSSSTPSTGTSAASASVENVNWPLNQTPMVNGQALNLSQQWFLFFNSLVTALQTIATELDAANAVIATSQNPLYSLTDPGTLAIQMNALGTVAATMTVLPTTVRIDVEQAPIGSAIVVNLYQNGYLWIQLTILAGATSGIATVNQLAAAGQIQLGAAFTGNIIQVGSSIVNGVQEGFPGAFLTATIQ